MSVWMSEKEFRDANPAAAGVTINVPFLQEIKQDNEFRHLLGQVHQRLAANPPMSARAAAEQLGQLRDQLETYFALEEFYGYFKNSAITNPSISHQATSLKHEHESLFLQFNEIVDTSEQIVYHECSHNVTVKQLAAKLAVFCQALEKHEQLEMELMLRMCNEDLGVGD